MADKTGITDAFIAEQLALEEKSTPRPWVLMPVGTIIGNNDSAAVKVPGAFDWICSMQLSNQPNWSNDGVFIVAACTNYPAALRALAEVRRRTVRMVRKGTVPDAPAWWSCRLCLWTWMDGDAELHDRGCPIGSTAQEEKP